MPGRKVRLTGGSSLIIIGTSMNTTSSAKTKKKDSSNYKQQHSSRSISPSGTNRRRSDFSPNILKPSSVQNITDIRRTSYDIIEHDVAALAKLNNLPAIDSFDALQLSTDRLRTIIAALECNILIRKDDLVRNLDYVANVLESVHQDETRRLMEDDDGVLSEIEPDSVPNEVRDWLAITFTRSMSTLKRQPTDKPKFKSVAQAIRAGIMVDRYLRRLSIDLKFKTINEWTFDIFSVNDYTNGQCLRFVGFELMQRYNLPNKLRISITALQNFLEQMEFGYSKFRNPYHNLVHAADVLQTTYQIIYNSGLMVQNWLSDHELFAMFIAAIVHDFEHTGTSNNFHIQSRSDVALIYNDRAVLENHHVSAAFRLMRLDDYNILAEFSPEEYKNFRHLVIEMVLATDMSSHFTQLKTMKTFLSMPENVEKSKALALVLHSADISHPGKPWEIHYAWTKSLMEEYFKQGDREKELGLPCSPLCDRDNTLIADSQIGFIQYIVEPSFVVMGDMLDKILRSLHAPDSELPSPSIPARSEHSSMSASPPPSTESTTLPDEQTDKKNDRKTSSISRMTNVRRPWVDYLRENRERWIREAEEDKRRREMKTIEEES